MNSRRLIRTAGIIFLLDVGLAGFGAEKVCFHVSPSGDDSADGNSPTQAFRTIARARDAARGHVGTVFISLANGTYELAETLTFTSQDRDLVFEAESGARPMISAGQRLREWSIGGDGRWRTRVPQGEKFAQLYVNGQRRVRPFLPRKGYFYAEKGYSPDPATGKARFVARKGHFPEGDNPGLEVCMFNVWTMSRSYVRSFDSESRVVSLALPNIKREVDAIGPGRWYRYDNVKSALGEPGDWHLDERNGELVYVPMPGETPDNCEVVAARHQHVVTFSCSTNIVWRGVTFAYANYCAQTNGYYYQAASRQPAAVQADRSKGIRFERCAIVHTGTYGVAFTGGSQNCAVIGCELRDLGAGGVKIGDWILRDGKKVLVGNCEVRDCLISEGGRVDPAGVGVWIGHAVSNVVSHCTIRDMYYSGISAGWNWCFAETARDNILEWNHIYDIGRHVLSDMGGIYLLGRQPGTVERFNHIHHVTRARNCAFGVYFDSGTSFVTVTNNVVHDCEDTNFFLAAISASNRVENNIFVCGPSVQVYCAPRNKDAMPTRYAHNIVAWDEGKFSYSEPGEDTIEFADNLYWCPKEIRPKNDPRGFTFAPLAFADLNARDLRLADTNIAVKAGFVPFSIDGCGKISAVSLTADMPKVPDVFFPAPEPIMDDIREDFETVAVGEAFPGWSILQPDGTNTIHVTERAAAGGRRSLEIIDDKNDWRPHMYRSIYCSKGRWKLSFALMIEDHAQPRIGLRGNDLDFPLHVEADGMLSADGKSLMKIEEGKWYKITVSLTMGKERKEHACVVTVSPPEGPARDFSVPLPPKMLAIHWIRLHSCGTKGRYYFDDFILAKDEEEK